MARPPRWSGDTKVVDGVCTVELSNWKYFNDYITKEWLDYSGYVWRGQRNAAWKLEPTLDRVLREKGKPNTIEIRREHLERFKYAARGRRGFNPPTLEEDSWWALGQHNFLATPLLDWTRSPYVAAYFAYATQNHDNLPRAVYALEEAAVIAKNYELFENDRQSEVVEIFTPHSDENPRLLSQAGLFTKSAPGVDLEAWVKQHFAGENHWIRLLKIVLPGTEREPVLRMLNRMNINHLTLFPDLYGASLLCNTMLTIEEY